MTKDEIKQEAQRLHKAERERQQIAATTTRFPGMDIEDAYAIQKTWLDLKIAEGRALAGYKIGLTSQTMQRSMNINEPDYGTLLDDMVFGEGSQIETARFLDPQVEVELAFVLNAPLRRAATSLFDVLRATEYVIPAVEIIAARTYRIDPQTGYKRTVRDTIADNAANAGIITGGRAVKPDSVDLRWVGAMLYKNGVLEETGLAAGVLNHPANGIVWLAKKYAQHGIELEPGKVILAGSFTAPVVAKAGDTFQVDFGALGSFGFKFI
jgi:2-oxo-hept-3-ene-1,7-dioate hydratase